MTATSLALTVALTLAACAGNGNGPTEPDPTTTSPASAPTPSGPVEGQGFTADEVYVGFVYNSRFDEQAAAAGLPLMVGSQREQVDAVVADINDRGGLAGRTLIVEFYDTGGAEAENASAVTEAACVQFTQDRPVLAAMTAVSQVANDSFFDCLSRNGVIGLAGVLGGGYDAQDHLSSFDPYLYMPGGVAVERLVPVWIERLAANDYFTGWDASTGQEADSAPVVGLLYGSNGDTVGPIANALRASVESELEAHGLDLAAAFETTGDPSQPGEAVLRFRQAGVTHILGDAALIGFAPAAAAQNYFPRLGFSSVSGTAFLSLLAAPAQLHGALGVGFNPPLDVGHAQDPGDVSPAASECRTAMEGAGQPTTERFAWAAMALICDAFNFLEGAATDGDLSPEGLQRGATSMGDQPPVSTFGITFATGRPDGASAVRDLGYDDECGCFVYLSDQDHDM